jgi:hypothetical protein
LNPHWTLDSTYMLPAVTRMTGIVKLVGHDSDAWQVRFIPAWIGDDSVPHVLQADDRRFAEIAEFIAASSEQAGFAAQISIDGNELVLRPNYRH